MSVTPLDYSYHLACFWQIHENQEPSLTLKMGSTQRGCWDQRLLQNHEWLDFKNRDMIQFFCFLLMNLSQREYRKMTSISASLFLCLIFHHFCVDSATFCSWFAGFSWSSLKTRQPQAGVAISMPSACSCWAVCRLCLSSATCTCALFWGWGWELH